MLSTIILTAVLLGAPLQSSTVQEKGHEIDSRTQNTISKLFPGTKSPPKQTPLQEKYRSMLNVGIDSVKPRVMESTAYLPTDGSSRALTATGRTARRGVVAVDPRRIPLNSIVYVENYGWAVAGDTGGAIKGNIVDVCIESRSACMQWGRRHVKVWVYPQKVTSEGETPLSNQMKSFASVNSLLKQVNLPTLQSKKLENFSFLFENFPTREKLYAVNAEVTEDYYKNFLIPYCFNYIIGKLRIEIQSLPEDQTFGDYSVKQITLFSTNLKTVPFSSRQILSFNVEFSSCQNKSFEKNYIDIYNIYDRIKSQLSFLNYKIIGIHLVKINAPASSRMSDWKEATFDTLPYFKVESKFYNYNGYGFYINFSIENHPMQVVVTTKELLNLEISKYPNHYKKEGYPHPNHDIIFLASNQCEREEFPESRDGELTNIFSNPRTLQSWLMTSYVQLVTKSGVRLSTIKTNNKQRVEALRKLLNV